MKVVKPYESVKNQKNTEQHTDFKWGRFKDIFRAAYGGQ